MSNISKGPKRLVRKRPTGSTFKPRPSREIDDRPYIKKRGPDDRDDRPRRAYDDDRPPRDRDRDRGRPGPRREFDGPPRDRDRGRPGGPRREFDGPPRGRSSFAERKWGEKPAGRPPREERPPQENRVLMDTVKRIESGMMEMLDRLAKIEKDIAGLK
ncbi:hypothetical protein KKC97_10785 [bacterium]|nr:hypothetical protein [bacterium]